MAGGFGAVGVFLWRRDRASLTDRRERRHPPRRDRNGLLVPLIATDFRSIWPDIPLRFGAVGALVVLFFAFGPGRNTNSERILAC